MDQLYVSASFNQELIREHFAPGTGQQPTILTVTNKGAAEVNELILDHLGGTRRDRQQVSTFFTRKGKWQMRSMTVFKGARIMITVNKDIDKGLINGMVAIILQILDRSMVLELADGRHASLALTRLRYGGAHHEAYSIAGGYAMTIHKSQGLTIPKVIIYWDSKYCQPGLAYTAMSRVRALSDIMFVGQPRVGHFRPSC